MRRPRLNALRTFEAAGRHLSFSIAGNELGVSQAAVSQQIRQLEGQLDAKLFLRRNRGLALTSVGEAYHLAVHEALDRLDVITDQLFPGTSDHVVTIQCTPSIAALWLSPHLVRLHARHPNIELRVLSVDAERAPANAGLADLEVVILEPGASGPDLHELMNARIMPVCAPSLLKDLPTATPADVLRHNLIHVIGYRNDWHRWLRSVGVKDLPVPGRLSFDGSLAALQAALNGDGIMLGRRPFIDPHLASDELTVPFGDAHVLTKHYYLRSRDTNRRQVVAAISDWLTELAAWYS